MSELLRKLSFCSDLVTYLVGYCKVATAGEGKDLPENEINIGENRGEGKEKDTVLNLQAPGFSHA